MDEKKIRFGLENINYTPDPRYWNMTRCLYQMGFDDSDDLRNVLNIPAMNADTETAKKTYYLERMGIIYWNMTHESPRSTEKLMDVFKKKRDNVKFGKERKYQSIHVETKKEMRPIPVVEEIKDIHSEVDKWLK